MTIQFIAPNKRTSHRTYSIGRAPVVGESVRVVRENEDGKVTSTFEGSVEKVEWLFCMKVKDHRVTVYLKEEE